jgi:hypothetical protein
MGFYIREILLERGRRQITNTAVGGCMQSQRHPDTTRFGIALVAALRTPLFLSGHLLRPETHSLVGMALPQPQLWRLKTGIMQIKVLRRLCVILAL